MYLHWKCNARNSCQNIFSRMRAASLNSRRIQSRENPGLHVIHGEGKSRNRSSAVLTGMTQVLGYSPFASYQVPCVVCYERANFGGSSMESMKEQMGLMQCIRPLLPYLYSRLASGTLSSSIHRRTPIHSLQLLFAAAVWLVVRCSPKRANTLRKE